MTYDAISNIIILFAAQKPSLYFSSSIFRYHFEWFFLEELKAIFDENKDCVSPKTECQFDICDCLH